jgi:hypothetical protein
LICVDAAGIRQRTVNHRLVLLQYHGDILLVVDLSVPGQAVSTPFAIRLQKRQRRPAILIFQLPEYFMR